MELHVPAHATATSVANGAPQDEHHGARGANAGQDGQPLADISNLSRIGVSTSGLRLSLLHASHGPSPLWRHPRRVMVTCHTSAGEVCSATISRMLALQAELLAAQFMRHHTLNVQRGSLRPLSTFQVRIGGLGSTMQATGRRSCWAAQL